MANPVIRVSSAKIGTKLSLELQNHPKEFNEWAVEDKFNGLTGANPPDKEIYGFFMEGNKVNLHLYKDGKRVDVIPDVQIVGGE